MNRNSVTVRALVAAVLALMLAACVDHAPPPLHPGPYQSPVDAFDATDAPSGLSAAGTANPPLANDLAHLRDARQAYEQSQAAQAANRRNAQEKCRNQPNARLVHINDGTDDPDAVYCQTSPQTSPASGDDNGS